MKTWKICEGDRREAEQLAETLDLPVPIAGLLVARGLRDSEGIGRFLNPRLSDLGDPFLLPDMAPAVERIWRAIERNESIAVYGDFDVDGITATALLVRVLARLGARVTPYLPKRMEEGYGLSLDAMKRCVDSCSPQLIITVDCGSAAGDVVAAAVAMGIDIVITDHHEVTGTRAQPLALVNPKLGADANTRMLAGVGVAFKLCHALLKCGRDKGRSEAAEIDLREYLEWVAIGTVADAAPLRQENRVLVSHGLSRLNNTQFAGLKALMDVARVGTKVGVYHVGFVLGPRINAVGRVGDAEAALELLLTDHPPRAQNLAATLDAANTERKRIERRIIADADRQISESFQPGSDFSLVIGDDGWHVGVIGIVASRLCSRYRRPVVVVGFDENGLGRGSCRSIEGFDLVEGLKTCGDLLEGFGGHSMAAGLWIRKESYAAFRNRFNTLAAEQLEEADLQPVQRIDAWLALGDADERFAEGIERLGPFGEGNPEPVWGAREVRIIGQPRVVGKDHLKFLCAAGGRQLDAICFNMADREVPDGPIDLAFTLEKNVYMGRENLQLNVQDFRAAE